VLQMLRTKALHTVAVKTGHGREGRQLKPLRNTQERATCH
jgi:hypothetical protein